MPCMLGFCPEALSYGFPRRCADLTPRLSRARKPQRSVGCRASAAGGCSAKPSRHVRLPPFGPHAYWITSSASRSRDGGIVIPSALAVLRLRTSSNVMGRSMGRSPGLAPFRILST